MKPRLWRGFFFLPIVDHVACGQSILTFRNFPNETAQSLEGVAARLSRKIAVWPHWLSCDNSMLSHMLSKKLFWLASRTGLAVYSRFPVFGPLKAAVGVMRREDTLLVIERNDGRGLSFPGGIQLPWEKPEQALVREAREETGLEVTNLVFKLRYYSSAEVPVNLTVFEMEAEGQLRSSWEGMPCWLPLSEVRQRLIASQRPVLESLERAENRSDKRL